MNPVLVLKMLVLIGVANSTPVVAKRLFGPRGQAIDGGRMMPDGHLLFGPSKTVRGAAVALLATSIAAPVLGESAFVGLAVGTSAMIGDLLSSFVKRRLALPPSTSCVGLDQVPESFLPALAAAAFLPLSIIDIATIVVGFFIGVIVVSRLAFEIGIRDTPM